MRKIYFKAYKYDLYISHKNNIAQLYFILGRAELHWNFPSILKDGFDIHRFSNSLDHVQSWKSVNIRNIPKSTGKVPTNTPNLLKYLQGVLASKVC